MLAAGKAAGSMAEIAERHYLDDHGLPADRLRGIVVTRPGYTRPSRHMQQIEAGHPVPDAAGLAATFETLALADAAGPDDLVLVLLSGGASANWIAPSRGTIAHRKAGADPHADCLRRIDRRDERRAQSISRASKAAASPHAQAPPAS